MARACKRCREEFSPAGHELICPKCKTIDRHKTQEKASARFFIFERDDFKCVYCGQSPIEDGVKLVIEHIIPKSQGGNHSPYNTITACWECNTRKANASLSKSVYERILAVLEKKNGQMSPLTLALVEKIFTEIFEKA